jgi:hypothetical protein
VQKISREVAYGSRVWDCDHHIVYLYWKIEPLESEKSKMHHAVDLELERNGKLEIQTGENHPRRRRGPNLLFQIMPVSIAVTAVVFGYFFWKRSF